MRMFALIQQNAIPNDKCFLPYTYYTTSTSPVFRYQRKRETRGVRNPA